ncbi:hypothetical protein KC950_02960 [Candidatus Saccharibacteria bacterium]|nr:hypothetical protein [Candidatus Saccharibacteria bacterium]
MDISEESMTVGVIRAQSPEIGGSQLVYEAGQEVGEINLFTEVSVLEESDFIDRYAGVIGLKDNVRLAYSLTGINGFPLDVLFVSSRTYEDRLRADAMLRESLVRVRASQDYIDSLSPVMPPEEPMTPDEVDQVSEQVREIRAKKEKYEELGRFQKFGHSLLLLARSSSSLATTGEEDRLADLPSVINITDQRDFSEEIIVRADVEEAYRTSR